MIKYSIKVLVLMLGLGVLGVVCLHTVNAYRAERAYRNAYYHHVWKKYPEAIAYYQEAMRYAPLEAYYRSQAVITYTAWLATNPEPESTRDRVRAQLEATVLAAIRLDDLSPWNYTQLGQIYITKSKAPNADKSMWLTQAQHQFERAQAIDHQNPLFSRSLAQFYHMDNQLDHAVKYYQYTLALDSRPDQFLDVRYNLGALYLNRGDRHLAYTQFESIASVDPTYQIVGEVLAKLYYEDKNYPKVREYLQKAYVASPYSVATLERLANFYLNQKDYANAEIYYKKLVNLKPSKTIYQQRHVYAQKAAKRAVK
jgi:tetratricopeptide (TPR) repeat protein